MNCTYYRGLISARRDGEITRDELADLDKHLRECPDCRAFARELADLGKALSERPREKFPENLERRILAETTGGTKRAAIKPSGLLRGYYRIPRGLAWAGILALVVLIFLQVFEPFSGNLQSPAPTPIENQPSQRIVLSQRDIVYTHSFHEPSDSPNGGN
jgi:anti-sigma factor RsiW